MKKIVYTTALFFLFTLPIAAGDKKNNTSQSHDSIYCIEIDGRVHIPKEDHEKSYKIELLYYNTIVDSGTVVENELFLLKIKKNAWYTIRILKHGYFPLLISIDTRLPEYNTDQHKFHFATDLIQENISDISDKDAIDFPIALISYHKDMDDFSPVEEYSRNIQNALFAHDHQRHHHYHHKKDHGEKHVEQVINLKSGEPVNILISQGYCSKN